MNFKLTYPKNSVVINSNIFEESHLSEFRKYLPFYCGNKLGHIRNGKFIPSLFLIEWIGKMKTPVILDDESEWLFVCGNSIPFERTQEEYMPVANSYGDCIGIARFANNKLKHVFDVGDILRRERKSKSKK